MEIIVTHRNADFDALAAQIAASKLYPDAVMVTAGGLSPSVKKFLALHRDHFELVPVKQLDLARVTGMIIVDVNNRGRLKDFRGVIERIDNGERGIRFAVYDHHAVVPDSLSGETVQIAPVGAAATLLIEKIQEAEIALTPMEATALALGIYADTGSLTFPSTTVRDSEAAAFCVRHGASMASLRYFLHQPLGPEQTKIFSALMTDVGVVDFNSIKFGITSVTLDKNTTGLSELVGKALMLQEYDATIAFFVKGKTVSIIARSRLPAVDVGEIMQRLGGGGHHGAGAANLKNCTLRQAKIKLMTALQGNPPTPRFVRDVMSTPVYTLTPHQKISDVHAVFSERRFSGAPVMRDGDLVGILSKRDTHAAIENGRAHLPVSSCMAQKVRTIAPTRSLARAVEIMGEMGVGRLPVLEENHLIGIITRNDILKVLYQS